MCCFACNVETNLYHLRFPLKKKLDIDARAHRLSHEANIKVASIDPRCDVKFLGHDRRDEGKQVQQKKMTVLA